MDAASGQWTSKDIWQTIFYGLQACAVFVALGTYVLQKRSSFKSEKQANRARLTEAYMNWHTTILLNDKNTILSGKMIRRGHALVSDENSEIHEETAREIHLMCLLLNTLFLEWNYRTTYDKPPYKDLESTIDNLLTGVVINSHKHYRSMIESFTKVFPDFPDEFTRLVLERIDIIRNKHGLPAQKRP